MEITVLLDRNEVQIDDLLLTIKWSTDDHSPEESLIHFVTKGNKLLIELLDPGSYGVTECIEDDVSDSASVVT